MLIEDTDAAIVPRTVDQALAEARAIARSIAAGGGVDAFLAERRQGAGRE